jgi:hypothetical protein
MSLWRHRTIFGGAGGLAGMATLHYWDTGATTPVEMEAQALSENSFWTAMRPFVSNQVTFTTQAQVDVLDITTGDIIDVQPVTSYGATGSATGDALPWATQGLINWRTGFYLHGRQLQGKTFIPGMTEAANLAGQMSVGERTGIQTAANNLITNTSLAVFSRKWFTAAQVTAANVGARWAFLSERRP